METTFIYGLVDPRTDEIRYIGKANDIRQRLKNHLNPARYRPTHKFNWIRKLRRLNMKPYLIFWYNLSFRRVSTTLNFVSIKTQDMISQLNPAINNINF